jgi:hypothetical protein
MRCMGCGAQMVLTAVAPDQTMPVRGFEHQTFRCFDCGVTEQTRTFRAGSPPVAEVTEPASNGVEPVNGTEALPAAAAARSRTWTRAVEKLRSREAEIRQRAERAKRTDWNMAFNQAWEQLAPAPAAAVQNGQNGQNGHSTYARPDDLAAMFARSVRGRLRKKAAMPTTRGRAAAPIADPSPEAAREFNRFWDSLSGSTPLQLLAEPTSVPNVPPQELLPLPKSVSLVPIEAPAIASAAARAISLLGGPLNS